MEVYSPELVTAQENLIYLLSNESDENSIVNAAKEKLRLLGMSESQIKMVCTNKKLQRTVTVFSKWSGVVREEIQNNNQGKTMNDNASSSGQYASNSFSVKEGMYVHEGQTIFNVVDPKKPVVMLQVKAKDIAAIRIKQQVILKTSDSISIKGKVDFIEPLLGNSKTTFIRVILEEKQTNLKTRMLMTGKIETEGVEGIFIPASAVIDAGRNKFVWVKKEGHFTAKKIEVGVTTKDWIEVYDGISEKDEIAVQGHYLLDSESFLKTEEDATE
jgi:Cu(I)/Ag(I) efflux system membrane fusion protein